MKIPPIDLHRQHQAIASELEEAARGVLHSGLYIGGQQVKDFEQQFAAYIGTNHCVGCNSGTDALFLALQVAGVGPGDEVITSSFTFIATAEVVSRLGATPVFVDIDRATFNIDPNLIEQAITPHTKAIIPVHLFGQPVNMTQIMAIAKKHNLMVIEDCAQATGASWEGQKVGSIGDFGCFSFFPTKNLGACGDGGAVTINNADQAGDLTMIREHGMKERYHHEVLGLNSRLDAMQAALLQVKLRHLDRWNQERQTLAQGYQARLGPLPIEVPQDHTHGGHSWNQFTILIPDCTPDQPESTRDRVRAKLMAQGIIAMVYYPIALHQQPVYQSLGYGIGSLPHTEQAAREVLSLPMFPGLTTEEQDAITFALKDCLLP